MAMLDALIIPITEGSQKSKSRHKGATFCLAASACAISFSAQVEEVLLRDPMCTRQHVHVDRLQHGIEANATTFPG